MFLVLPPCSPMPPRGWGFAGSMGFALLTMVGLFIPLQVIMIPIAVLVRDLHISKHLWAAIVPYAAFNLPFTMLVLYGAMRACPLNWKSPPAWTAPLIHLLLKIIVPNVKAPWPRYRFSCFMSVWNEYNLALIR